MPGGRRVGGTQDMSWALHKFERRNTQTVSNGDYDWAARHPGYGPGAEEATKIRFEREKVEARLRRERALAAAAEQAHCEAYPNWEAEMATAPEDGTTEEKAIQGGTAPASNPRQMGTRGVAVRVTRRNPAGNVGMNGVVGGRVERPRVPVVFKQPKKKPLSAGMQKIMKIVNK